MRKYRKPFYRSFLSRCTWTVSDGWHTARFFWYKTDKGPLVFFCVLGLIVTTFGFLVYSIFAGEAHRQNLTCLALNVYFEARGEPTAGQYAVAEVTMNRVASSRYPDTVCAVVFQQNWDARRRRYVAAFSWTEFNTRPMPEAEAWQRAREVAEAVYHRRHKAKLDGALHYHSVHIKPRWSRGRKPIARIGKHVFYK